jgi:hypothetical protein
MIEALSLRARFADLVGGLEYTSMIVLGNMVLLALFWALCSRVRRERTSSLLSLIFLACLEVKHQIQNAMIFVHNEGYLDSTTQVQHQYRHNS